MQETPAATDPATDPAADPAADPEAALQSRRLMQLARIVLVGLFLVCMTTAQRGNWLTTAILASGFVLIAVFALMNRLLGATGPASLGILWTLTFLATAAMWLNQGLYSPALLAYPCILLTANMLSRRLHFVLLLLFMLAAMAFMAWASISGLRVFIVTAAGWPQFVYLSVILVACSLMVALLAGDLRNALLRLKAEVDRVRDAKDKLRYQATHDALTGLPNRFAAQAAAQGALAHAARHGRQVGFVFVNIDNFKHVNESLGHSAGDELLRQFAGRLKTHTRAYDAVTRYSGDEFLLLISDVSDSAEISAMASHVLTVMSESFRFEDITVGVSCSIGVSIFPNDGQDFETLLQKADIAVHHAKEAGRNVFRFFDESMNANMLEDLNISTGLRSAIARNELTLHYQPLVDLASGRLLGTEALLRWQHPERGNIPPGRFIPVAERSGQVVELGQWVLDAACRQVKAWRGTAFENLVVSINVSTVQFKRGTLESVMATALERHGVPPGNLELEVTESALIHDPESFVQTLRGLKKLGLRLSIDDFGTGYSNLSYLQRFEIDKLKIDQSFVRRLSERGSDHAIVRAIIQMAKSLNLATTAEGIEDEKTRALLLELGCDQGQGFVLGRPQPVERFEQQFAQLVG